LKEREKTWLQWRRVAGGWIRPKQATDDRLDQEDGPGRKVHPDKKISKGRSCDDTVPRENQRRLKLPKRDVKANLTFQKRTLYRFGIIQKSFNCMICRGVREIIKKKKLDCFRGGRPPKKEAGPEKKMVCRLSTSHFPHKKTQNREGKELSW